MIKAYLQKRTFSKAFVRCKFGDYIHLDSVIGHKKVCTPDVVDFITHLILERKVAALYIYKDKMYDSITSMPVGITVANVTVIYKKIS